MGAFELQQLLKMKNGQPFDARVVVELVEDYGNRETISFDDFTRLWQHIREKRVDEFDRFANVQDNLSRGRAL